MDGTKMKILDKIKGRMAAGAMLVATGVLLTVTGYTDVHRQQEVVQTPRAEMNASLVAVETDLVHHMEAQEIDTVISGLDTVSLSSYYEIQEARALVDGASGEARAYIDEEKLVDAEAAYARLNDEREQQLQTALASGSLSDILDYAPCQVQLSGDAYLDTLVQELIQAATTADMSRSEQLQACYTYMVQNYSYGYNYSYSYSNGKKSIAWATAFLRDGYGACNNWSSAFVYVARALGYDADLCYGSTASSRGGGVEHYWPVITIADTEYVFDPQVEKDMTRRSGAIAYKRYGLTGSAASAKYYFQQIVE